MNKNLAFILYLTLLTACATMTGPDRSTSSVKSSDAKKTVEFGYTILYAKDAKGTVEFYERAFSLKRAFIHEIGEYAEMNTGGTRLAFTSIALARKNGVQFSPVAKENVPPGFEVVLVSDDVDALYEKARAAGAISV